MLVTADSLEPKHAAKDIQSMSAGSLEKGSQWNYSLMAGTIQELQGLLLEARACWHNFGSAVRHFSREWL